MTSGGGTRIDLIVGALGLVVLIGGVAWLLLGDDDELTQSMLKPSVTRLKDSTQALSSDVEVSAEVGEKTAITLEKARMALDADMLADPPGQNALYFYSLALESDPDNTEIQEEFAGVTDAVANVVRGHIGANRFADASTLSSRLATVSPDAPVLAEVRRVIEKRRASLVELALEVAANGDDAEAQRLVKSARALPGNPALLADATKRLARIAEQRANEAAAMLVAEAQVSELEPDAGGAAEEALRTRLEAIAASIADGNLLEPDNYSALSQLRSARKGGIDDARLDERELQLMRALIARAQRQIAFDQLADADSNINALATLDVDPGELDALRGMLDDALIRRESQRIVPANTLTLLERVPPVYPRAALRRSREGWVEVEFTVTRDGRTEDITVVDSASGDLFNKATVQAVAQWLFEPRVFRGRAIDQRVVARVSFRISQS